LESRIDERDEVTETTYQRLREQVAKDAGLPSSAAATFQGETIEICAQEALEYARTRRGDAGVREVHRNFAEADLRESPDQIRERVARDLGLPYELKSQLSSATRTEAEIVDDGLSLLRQSGGQAALDAGVRKLQGKAMDALIRERAAGPQSVKVFDESDPNAWLRAVAGRDTDAA
jgi:hypothetical protein